MAVRLLPVFCWHNVLPSWLTPVRADRSRTGFEQQLRVLASCFSVIPLDEALSRLESGATLPPRAAALTFDDGYRDALDVAAPALERLGLSATFFLVPGLLSRDVAPWWEVTAWAFARATRRQAVWEKHRLDLRDDAVRAHGCTAVLERLKLRDAAARDAAIAELVEALEPKGAVDENELFLDWGGARKLAAHSGVAIGSHTRSHPILSRESCETQLAELRASRIELEQGVDRPVTLLAYPNGQREDYDACTVSAARDAGYAYALTSRGGLNRTHTPRFELRRVALRPEKGVAGLLRPIGRPAMRLVRGGLSAVPALHAGGNSLETRAGRS